MLTTAHARTAHQAQQAGGQFVRVLPEMYMCTDKLLYLSCEMEIGLFLRTNCFLSYQSYVVLVHQTDR